MAEHNELGKLGEEMAAKYLAEKGHVILHQNWRFSFYEIDLISLKDGTVHIVEVKSRSSKYFGLPEASVSKKKYRDLMKATDVFLSQHLQYRYVQLDILSINMVSTNEVEYFLIEDVFY